MRDFFAGRPSAPQREGFCADRTATARGNGGGRIGKDIDQRHLLLDAPPDLSSGAWRADGGSASTRPSPIATSALVTPEGIAAGGAAPHAAQRPLYRATPWHPIGPAALARSAVRSRTMSLRPGGAPLSRRTVANSSPSGTGDLRYHRICHRAPLSEIAPGTDAFAEAGRLGRKRLGRLLILYQSRAQTEINGDECAVDEQGPKIERSLYRSGKLCQAPEVPIRFTTFNNFPGNIISAYDALPPPAA